MSIGKTRKYVSEFAVSLCTSSWLMTTAEQLTSGGEMGSEQLKVSKKCHIYLILTRPALSYCQKSFVYANGNASGELRYREAGSEKTMPFSVGIPLHDGAVGVRLSDYPHREIQTFDSSGQLVRYYPASALSIDAGLHLSNPDLQNFDVLYVGQAYGTGNRSAFDRLRSHSTLQKILADLSYKAPEREVFLATFVYEPYRLITSMDGRAVGAQSGEADSARFSRIIQRPLKQIEQVCLAEAALIRYFQPPYNDIYKKKFPSKEHKILKECYALDFSALIVEINTDDYRINLRSGSASAAMHHIAKIDLVDHEARASFFHMSNGAGGHLPVHGLISGET